MEISGKFRAIVKQSRLISISTYLKMFECFFSIFVFSLSSYPVYKEESHSHIQISSYVNVMELGA